MKRLGIYLSPISHESGPVFTPEPYTSAYPQLFRLLRDLGVEYVLVHSQCDTYQGDGVFSEYYRVDWIGDKHRYVHCRQPVHVDFVYDKARFEASDVAVLNLPYVRDVCRNKMLSYELFPTFHPATTLLHDDKEVDSYIAKKGSEIVVVKGLDSNGGEEVYIGEALAYNYAIAAPVIVQDFVETKAGYVGLVEGRHDVRVFVFDGDILGGKLRTPPDTGFLSNIGFGGFNRSLEIKELPSELIALAREIDHTLGMKSRHRFIAADFGYDGEKWVLFEVNPWPGLVDASEGVAAMQFMSGLAVHLAQCIGER